MEHKPLNWGAIHQAYADHQAKHGASAQQPMPQPQQQSPTHSMMVHAMSLANTQPGENHQTMIIKALEQHLKRITPDVSNIHASSEYGQAQQ